MRLSYWVVIFVAAALLGCSRANSPATPPSHASDIAPAPEQHDYVDGEVLVVFNKGVDEKDIGGVLGNLPIRIFRVDHLEWADLYVLGITDGTSVPRMVERLKFDSHVRFAEPNGLVHAAEAPYWPNDPMWESSDPGSDPRDNVLDEWGPPKMGTDLVWNDTKGSSDTVVALMDSGVRFTHEDLGQCIWINEGEIPGNGIDDDHNGWIDDWRGWDCIDNDNDPWDPGYTHGTGGAGVIAATQDNGLGVTGIAPHIKIMVLRCIGPWEAVVMALDYAKVNGAKVGNMSFGGGYSDIVKAACDAAWDNGNGVILIASSGNGDKEQMWYPAGFDSVQATGAVTAFNAYNGPIDEHRVSVTNNYLWGSDYGSYLAITGYGAKYLSTSGSGDSDYLDGTNDNFYNGTSCSAPVVSAVLALVYSYFPEKSPEWIWERVRDTADDLQDVGYDIETGYGRVNPFRAIYGPDKYADKEDADGFVPLKMPEDKVFDSIHDVPGNPYQDVEDLYKLKAVNSGQLKIGLDIYTWGENLDLALYSDKGLTNQVAISNVVNHFYSSSESINVAVSPCSEYYLKVYSPSPGNSSIYGLSVANQPGFEIVGHDKAPGHISGMGVEVPFLKLDLTSPDTATFSGVVVSILGSLPLSKIVDVKLIEDTNESGQLDNGDQLIEVEPSPSVNRVRFDGLSMKITKDYPRTFFVAVDTESSLKKATLGFSIETYKDATTAEGYQAPYGEFPIRSSMSVVGG